MAGVRDDGLRLKLRGHFTAMRVMTIAACLIILVQFSAYRLIENSRRDRLLLDAQVTTLADLARSLANAEDALHNVAGRRQHGEAIAAFYSSLRDVETLYPRLERRESDLALGPTVRGDIKALIGGWRRAVAAFENGEDATAIGVITLPKAERAMSIVQQAIESAIERGRRDSAQSSARIRVIFNVLFWFQVASTAILAAVVGFAYRRVTREARGRLIANDKEAGTRRRLELLFGMHDMLQAAEDHRDANLTLAATGSQLAADVPGALYVFNNSGDRLNLSTQWGPDDRGTTLPTAIVPGDCWALKRGKAHINGQGDQVLRCMHLSAADQASIEVPMIARGHLLGMLVLIPATSDAIDELRPIATALADGMSLALSNIALRERLRTQALRDGLTGLYNRRYMEDALERVFDSAGLDGPASSILMIDLDHFKAINDEHGHAVGDGVLRDVGPLLLAGLRKTDIACRYGGEELVVVLPNCDHDNALARAELVRARIEALSDNFGFRITASLGVATSGPHLRSTTALLKAADAALYDAKMSGRNRVSSAEGIRVLGSLQAA